MDIIIILSWCIWMARNDFIFQGLQHDLDSVRGRFKKEFSLVIYGAKESLKQPMNTWLQLFV
jgi:hypothetical protein